MGRHRNYIAHWRKFRDMRQRDVIEKLEEIRAASSSREKFPATEASLSRVESGVQNFNMALLTALADVLDVERPGDLLTVNPFKGTLRLMHAIEALEPGEREAALKVIEVMRSTRNPSPGDGTDGDEAPG